MDRISFTEIGKWNWIQSVFFSYFMGERRELNPRVVDSQSTALVHLATSAPEKQTNCLYLQSFLLGRNDEANVCMWVGDLLQGIKARSMTNSQPTIEQVFRSWTYVKCLLVIFDMNQVWEKECDWIPNYSISDLSLY